ncbi:hypothetical protein STSP1_00700 [Sedimentisphaera salicampi]|uniref:Uncharacterized protein n=1 Tax=Sedimentisphaera salicampi TaxID=1941349 RepID=A0A1W6LKP8_9BACT|nr:hypothetical protein STSP1_00700 [Sedimentisphaera salicampi]OXU15602.1 hypothetical protein SMSP1_00684 [Sedimentisphaera salicampi]
MSKRQQIIKRRNRIYKELKCKATLKAHISQAFNIDKNCVINLKRRGPKNEKSVR